MHQQRDPMLVLKWRVSWTDNPSEVRVTDVYSSLNRTSAQRIAERAHPEGRAFRVGPYLGGVSIPEFHTAPAPAHHGRAHRTSPVKRTRSRSRSRHVA